MKFDEKILNQDFLPTPVKLNGVWRIFPANIEVPTDVENPIEYSENHYKEMVRRGFPFKHNGYYQQELRKDVWWVKSKSSSIKYKVELLTYGWRCDCQGFKFRGKCRHIDKIKTRKRIGEENE